jgi:hypothetical protein
VYVFGGGIDEGVPPALVQDLRVFGFDPRS